MGQIDNRLISALYGAIEEEARWTEAMDLLRDNLGVESAVVQMLSARSPQLEELWTSRDTRSLRAASIHDSWANSPANPRFRRSFTHTVDLGIGSDQSHGQYSPVEREALRQGLSRCGLGPAFWLGMKLPGERNFTLIFHRRPGDERDIGEAELGLLQTLAPHLRQIVRLWSRLDESTARAGLAGRAACSLASAQLTCDSVLRIGWMNDAARALLDEDGPVRVRGDVLVCRQTDDTRRLRALVSDPETPGVAAFGRAGDNALHIRAVRIDADCGGPLGERTMLVLSRPEQSARFDRGEIASLFSLTPAETALACALAEGASVSSFAAGRGITEGTARLQLKQVLAKTGARRQADLVRLLCTSVASRWAIPAPILTPLSAL